VTISNVCMSAARAEKPTKLKTTKAAAITRRRPAATLGYINKNTIVSI
jgi:hypothetical protein